MVIFLVITITFVFSLCKTLVVVNVHDLQLRFLVVIIFLWDGSVTTKTGRSGLPDGCSRFLVQAKSLCVFRGI